MAANVDTTRVIDELEALLNAGDEPSRCEQAITILWRWQWDGDLDEPSRRRARSGHQRRAFGQCDGEECHAGHRGQGKSHRDQAQ